jgi:hypothetical protein
LRQAHEWWGKSTKGKLVIEFLSSLEKIKPAVDDIPLSDHLNSYWGLSDNVDTDNAATDRFMDPNNDRLIDRARPNMFPDTRRQSQGMPTSVCRKVCKRCFPVEYESFAWAHALNGLDYLRDLENTRRAALRETAVRLGITESDWKEKLLSTPEAKHWIELVQQQELAIEALYAKVYVDLRIWVSRTS